MGTTHIHQDGSRHVHVQGHTSGAGGHHHADGAGGHHIAPPKTGPWVVITQLKGGLAIRVDQQLRALKDYQGQLKAAQVRRLKTVPALRGKVALVEAALRRTLRPFAEKVDSSFAQLSKVEYALSRGRADYQQVLATLTAMRKKVAAGQGVQAQAAALQTKLDATCDGLAAIDHKYCHGVMNARVPTDAAGLQRLAADVAARAALVAKDANQNRLKVHSYLQAVSQGLAVM